VWLTIDDGPDPADTPAILDLLDRYGARATFFLKGERAAAHPDVVKAMVDRGHQVQNHSQSHPTRFFWCAPPATVEREIRGCNAAIAGAGAPEPVLFRAPVGIKSPALHPVLGRLGMRLCAWSIRAFDGVSGFDPAAVEARVLGQLAPGAILCMHQGVRDRGGAPLSPKGLERVLAGLSERGYRCEIPALDRLR
ncbi:MAG: polysaccharide deacetylase family protein, partial [Myxococcales bacterium]|nr:polysaccharide deacetylase family protein [Myxococcales bacterium]